MKAVRRWPVVATALALFAMLFGSGNIAFPLGLGRDLGSSSLFAMIGFFLTAVFVPLLGVVSMALFQGDYRAFLSRIGVIPGRIVVAICFALMGPLCVIPRCMAFSYLALQWMVPSITLWQYTLLAGLLTFLVTWRKSGVVELMGAVLGPIKLILLGTVVVKGLMVGANMAACSVPDGAAFAQGAFVGYGTLDLLAVLFCSELLISGLAKDASGRPRSQSECMSLLMRAGALGALLLGILYAGFVLVAARQSAAAACLGVEEGQLLSVLASIILGAGGGYLASITMMVACSTTAIALSAVFADYVATESAHRIGYHRALMLTVFVAMVFANVGAAGIKALLAPIVMVLYPALMVLAITNLIWKMVRVDLGAIPFYAALGLSFIVQYWY